MATSTAPGQSSQRPAPFSLQQRRRTLIACFNCRKRKVRCISAEKPPKVPCTRCRKHNLMCEYPDMEHDASSTSSRSPEFTSSDIPDSPPVSISPHQSDFGRRALPSLPYTRPPPPNYRPRYSGAHYPDLSTAPQQGVDASISPSKRGVYYRPEPSHPRPPDYGMQPAQPYQQYLPRRSQTAPTPLRGTIPSSIASIPFFADPTPMPGNESFDWSAQHPDPRYVGVHLVFEDT
ncbi:hypothetical protein C8F04DRAFT_1134854 [Mycena alexandri]|uniref:Zn(2)-C6 fungal-type domain-containing protein n=1 Tax=Mycena alexandri TaxID=1745969 RepID=A0AAD6WQD8_9AGAR|nr:hypothetical protein C8F04DRAFT_1134854 [Mycena alexandri]